MITTINCMSSYIGNQFFLRPIVVKKAYIPPVQADACHQAKDGIFNFQIFYSSRGLGGFLNDIRLALKVSKTAATSWF